MSIIAEHLLAGYIFGDHSAEEYVYMPDGEVGVDDPLCVIKTRQGQRDISLEDAVKLVHKLGLKRVKQLPF